MQNQIIEQLKGKFEERIEWEQENNSELIPILCIADYFRLLLDLNLSGVISKEDLDISIEYLKDKVQYYAEKL